MLPYIVAGLTAAVLVTAAAWFSKRWFEDLDPAGGGTPLDETPQDEPAGGGTPLDGTPQDEPAGGGAPLDGTPQDEPAGGGASLDETPQDEPAGGGTSLDGTPQDGPAGGGASLDETPQDEPAETPPPLDTTLQNEPAETPPPLDGTPQAREAAAPAATLGVRWSWRRHRSGLQFLRVTVANPGPNAATLTRIRLRTSAELADRADPPPDLLEASDYAVELFGPAPEAVPLPRTVEPGASAEAYFPCRDVADWLYGVAENDNIDRNECHLTPECVDATGVSHHARQKVGYERWLQHGHGPSLREYAEERDPQSAAEDR